MRYLVTGGAGFIGSHLVDRLVIEGHEVRILDNLSTGTLANLTGPAAEAELLLGDLRSTEDVAASVRDIDVIVHLGALGSVPRSVADPLTTHDVNATGTLRLLLAARDAECERVVFAASSSTYGDDRNLPKIEDRCGQPLSPYATSKLAAEHYCRQATELYGLTTVRLRFFNVFGPRQSAQHVYAAAIPRFIHAARNFEPITVHGDGEQSRDFTYIDNNLDGIALAAAAPAATVAGNVYNLACGRQTTINSVLAHIAELHEQPLVIDYQDPRPADVRHSLADISRITEALGYEPTISVADGIDRTWQAATEDTTPVGVSLAGN